MHSSPRPTSGAWRCPDGGGAAGSPGGGRPAMADDGSAPGRRSWTELQDLVATAAERLAVAGDVGSQSQLAVDAHRQRPGTATPAHGKDLGLPGTVLPTA